MEKIRIKNSQGKNISAVIHSSETKQEKLAILCPGYLDTKDYAHLVKLAEAFVDYGYTAVRFDPTGTWESEGDISEYTKTQYLDDIKNVLEYMLTKEDFKHVLLAGHSRGGQISILYAARDPRISIVVGIMPSSGGIKGSRREQWEIEGSNYSKRDLPDGKDGIKEFRVPFSHVLDGDKYDVVEDVKKIKIPIILIAGELDDLVPPEDVKKIFDHSNEPKSYVVLKKIGHDYRHNPAEIEIVNNEIINEVEKVVKC